MRTPHSFRFRHFTVIALYTCAAALQGQDQGLPVRPTAQWELNACILAPLATGEPTAASASIQEGATWRASVGYRPGRRLVLLAGYGMCVSRRGESANDHITGSSVTWDFLFGTTTVLEHGCDLLTTKEAVHTLALDAAWLVRPFRDRHLIGMSFRAVGGLYVVGVRAEQGLVLGARYETEESDFYNAIGIDISTRGGDEALSRWDQRQVVNTHWSMGINLHFGLRADVHITRFFAATFGANADVALVEPQVKPYTVEGVHFPSHSVQLTGLRPAVGVMVAF